MDSDLLKSDSPLYSWSAPRPTSLILTPLPSSRYSTNAEELTRSNAGGLENLEGEDGVEWVRRVGEGGLGEVSSDDG